MARMDISINFQYFIIHSLLSCIQLMLAKGAETLPGKVAHDYKALAKLYDSQSYKKGLKNAQKILEKFPDHPETLAMKALFQMGLGQQAKAQATAKIALMKSKMSSMFCWHTYGSVMKQKKNFIQAAKCYQAALNFQKDNMQLLRQTASLQIQVRDHSNHVATRLKILKQKPGMINNWVAFAVAHHLKADYEQLYKALASIDNLRAGAEMKPIEISHYFIYRAIAFADGDRVQTAYDQLVKNKKEILDQDVWNELMYKYCLKLNKNEEAVACLETLIRKYPENVQYMRQYQKINKLTPRETYAKIRTEFKSNIAKIHQLSYMDDPEQFRKSFIAFIRPYYQKNLISLFAEIQVLYETTPHSSIIESVFVQTEASLRQQNQYLDNTQALFPTQHLWSLYLLAQHYSRSFDTLPLAYTHINRAIEHTMTITQFYVVKAQIQYKMHNNLEAVRTINQARKTDLADRYMNNLCIRYLLKCQKTGLAEDVLRLFMRDQASLYELQNQWYIIEMGKSFLKQRNMPAGLRHLYFVEKQFKDIEANQYDFHTFCIRKWTLKQYLEYITFNDNIFKDKKYTEAAGYAMEYLFEYQDLLEIEANKPKQEEDTKQEQAKKKKKKNKQKQVTQVEELTPVEAFRKKIDYYGKQWAERVKANPMEEAYTYAKNVTTANYVNKNNIKQNKLYAKAFSNAIRVFIRQNKPLLVIKALKKLIKTQADPFLILLSTIRSLIYFQSALSQDKTHEITKQFMKEYIDQLLGQNKTAQQLFTAQEKQLPAAYNRDIRIAEIKLALSSKQSRQELVNFYTEQLNGLIVKASTSSSSLQNVFYLVHRLQFFDCFTAEQKVKLNQIYGQQTTYFTEWLQQIDRLPASTWGIFWLSDYDLKREEQALQQGAKQQQSTELTTVTTATTVTPEKKQEEVKK